MDNKILKKLPSLLDFPESERNETVKLLLQICKNLFQEVKQQSIKLQLQSEQISLQREQIQLLRDEISILKGEKGKPKIKASKLENKDNNNKKGEGGKKSRGKPKHKKTKKLKIDEEKIIQPDYIPKGSEFKGYEDYVVQDIEIKTKNTKYRRARYLTPEGNYIIGKLPTGLNGSHFGVNLRSFILSQYYQQHVTQGLILTQLRELGIEISSGQINNILIEKHQSFHQEKESILSSGLAFSEYIGVDDTGARHKGKNGYCTRIGNEFFTYFSSTSSKSRINFLELLQCDNTEYVIDEQAHRYMQESKLAKAQIALLVEDCVFFDKESFLSYLKEVGIVSNRHIKIITEASLFASLVKTGISNNLVILSDDAKQFAISGVLNALCWIHAERNIKKIIAYNNTNREIQINIQNQIWEYYQKLKTYKASPDPNSKTLLEKEFDKIFSQKTEFQTLNLALERILLNKEKLLIVLEHPTTPLHNNLSENDIRDYVKKRKISATTRSDTGQKARDTFLSLKKTCLKLKINFGDYLKDRLALKFKIPPLEQLVQGAAQS